MAKKEEKAEEAKAAGESGAEDKPKGPSKLPMIISLTNTVAIMGALAALVYTQVMFERPKITESGERAKIELLAKEKPKETTGGNITLEPMTVNIAPGQGAEHGVQEAKLHYVTVTMVLEIRDMSEQSAFEAIKQVFMDQVLHSLGKKKFEELVTFQGRYLFRAEVLDTANTLIRDPVITNVFFTQFIVQ